MEDAIYLLDPYDIPLIGGVNAQGTALIGSGSVFETQFKWMDDTLLAPRDTGGTTLAMGGATLTFSSASASLRFQAGDVVRIENELIRLGTFNYTAGTAAISSRGFASTSDVAHTAPFQIVGVGTALPEGSDAGIARTVDRSERTNYTQILGPVTVKMSGTEMVVRKYGVASEWDHQLASRIKEFGVLMEQNLLYSLSSNDSANKIRTTGGLTEFITTVVDSTVGSITNTRVVNMLQTLFDNGAEGNYTIVLGSEAAKDFSSFNDGTIFVPRADRGRGTVVQTLETDFGRVTKVLDRWLRISDAFVFGPGNVSRETLRPTFFKRLGVTGDSESGILVYEGGYRIRGNKHMGKFTGLN
jgi:Family of unknown function (DUF5309)